MKRIALILVCCVAVAALTLHSADAEATLGIGSDAPALDIAHYFDEDDAKVTKFSDGNVYVVEFWATWCPPCVASMPHLSELQTKYRDQGVQIISISDEPVEEIKAILDQPHPQAGKTYAEVTAGYTLTTDPDGSSQVDYMEAANQQGIPTSFIVGKTGLIEWIGHPMELDEPLAKILDDSWDREAYKKEMELNKIYEETVMQLQQLAGTGRYEEASKMLAKQIDDSKDEELKARLQEVQKAVQPQFNLLTGSATKEDFDLYRGELKSIAGNVPAMHQYAMMLFGITRTGGNVGPLAKEAGEVFAAEVEKAEGVEKAFLLDGLARLRTVDNDLKKAFEAQSAAVALVESIDDIPRSDKKRMALFLDELDSKVNAPTEEESEDEAPSDK